MIDLDHFKTVNERYGHTTGEAVLNQLARQFEQAIRDVDFAARIGNEEFLLVLSQTDIAGALQMLERLREAIAGQAWQGCPELRLTLSVGVSGYWPRPCSVPITPCKRPRPRAAIRSWCCSGAHPIRPD